MQNLSPSSGGARGGLFQTGLVEYYNVFVKNPSAFNGNFYSEQYLKCYIVEQIITTKL